MHSKLKSTMVDRSNMQGAKIELAETAIGNLNELRDRYVWGNFVMEFTRLQDIGIDPLSDELVAKMVKLNVALTEKQFEAETLALSNFIKELSPGEIKDWNRAIDECDMKQEIREHEKLLKSLSPSEQGELRSLINMWQLGITVRRMKKD